MSSVRLFVIAALARTYPRVAWMFRNRTWFLQEAVLPALSVAALTLVYRWMGRPDYGGIVILGSAMTAFWLNVLWSMGAQLYWERDGGNLELYVMSPAPMMSILAGMALGGMTMTCVRAAVILTTGLVMFQIPFAPTSWWHLGLVFALTLVALYGMGMTFASVFLRFGREAWHTVNLLQEPVYLLVGMNFPLVTLQRMLHFAVPAVALLIPLASGLDAMRQILFQSDGFIGVWWETGILAVLSAVFLVLAKWSLDALERRAKTEGTLTVKWQ